MITKTDIIKDTYNFYSADPVGRRSIIKYDGGVSCLYKGLNEERCAFARYCEEDELIDIEEGLPASSNLNRLRRDVEHIRDKRFWNAIQSFHDEEENWDLINNCISAEGEIYYNSLLERFK